MKIWSDDSIRNFNFCSGARDTVNDLFDSLTTSSGSTIIDEKGVRNMKVPDPDFTYPKVGFYNMKNIKPTITRKNIILLQKIF